MDCCVRATVLQKEPPRRITGGRVMNRVLAADDSGILSMTWFNASYAANNLVVGETYYFEGRIGGTLTRRRDFPPAGAYRGPGRGLSASWLSTRAPTVCPPPATPAAPTRRWPSPTSWTDPLPPELLTRYRMPTKAAAVRGIHAPQSSEELGCRPPPPDF